MYPCADLKFIERYESLAKRMEVDTYATNCSHKGFHTALRYYGWEFLPSYWKVERESFLNKTIAAYNHAPSMQKWLALAMWGYKAQLPNGTNQ